MMVQKFTKLALCSVAALFVAGQAFAHTGVRDVAAEGTGSYNAFTITHGCGGDGGQGYPVVGQSALFPFGALAVWRDAAGNIIQQGGNGNGTISAPSLNLGVAGVAGYQSTFTTTEEIVDANGTVQALVWKDGTMAPNLYTLTPFRVAAPTIADSCVKELRIRMGVINYCDIGKRANNDASGPYTAPKDIFGNKIPMVTVSDPALPGYLAGTQTNVQGAPKFENQPAGNGDNNRADWWFAQPVGGSSLYNDPDLLQPTYWTTMRVINTNYDSACASPKEFVTVEPHGAAFDSYLTGPRTRPFTAGNNNL
jgi:hypothetical protein